MNTKDFLARVSATTGELLICTHTPDATGKDPRGIFWNRGSFADLDDAVHAIHTWDKAPEQTVYFTVGRFAGHHYKNDKNQTRYHRYKHLATSFKSLAIDLDIGPDKPYATQRDGWIAMQGALAKVGLPTPMVVSSGNGIHCYWPLVVDISAKHWETASIALRLALEEGGVQIDTSKVHDLTMVLRPLGTHNKKQTPAKEVKLVQDCPDYEPMVLFGVLKPWFNKAGPAPVHTGPKKMSKVMSALLDSGDISLAVVASKCAQIGALVSSGGAVDTQGANVENPLWRLSIGFAKYCDDSEAAVVSLAGGHPKFNLADNLAEMQRWKGTGPTTCAKFEEINAAGCAGCKYRGTVKSPAGLSADLVVEPPPGVTEIELPYGYFIDGGKVWTEEEKEVPRKKGDADSGPQIVTHRVLVCPYEIHVLGMYTDHGYSESTATLAVKYPLGNWQQHDLPMATAAITGKDWASYLMHKQIFLPTTQILESTRVYIMRYLQKVQQETPTGADFHSFGWQPDGSFLCGETLIGSPTGNMSRRLKGAAARYTDIIKAHGDRAEWVRATDMLNHPGSDNIAASMLIAGIGVLGKAPGNSSFILSIYSDQTTTGKTLSLLAANSLFGHPKSLLMSNRDTVNAIFKVRGTLNHLPGAMDELTLMEPEVAVDLAYSFSEGREKLSLTKDRDVREPVTWDGPTIVSCNSSLYGKFESVMQQNDPVRARTLEFGQHDKVFVEAHGRDFWDIIDQNYGFALPEIVEAVLAKGGSKAVWDAGVAAYNTKYSFVFQEQERFYRTALIGAWIVGSIGKALGLFKFDVNRVALYMQAQVVSLRQDVIASKVDAFDIIGQFMQENNERMIVAVSDYEPNVLPSNLRESVQFPVPDTAVVRMNIVRDTSTPVMPGSRIAINEVALKRWLDRTKDSMARVVSELQNAGAVTAKRARVTIYKGCQKDNPGQAFCLVLNLNHPRFAAAFGSSKSFQPSAVSLAMVQGGKP